MRFSMKKKVATAGLVVATVVGGATAYGYWSAGGSGSGTATADGSVTAKADTAAVTGLYPGGSHALTGTIAITNGTHAYIQTITPSFNMAQGDWQSGCSEADFTLPAATTVAGVKNNGDTVSLGSIQMNDRSDATVNNQLVSGNQDGCKGQTVKLTLTVSGS